jgi:hypothetical protein
MRRRSLTRSGSTNLGNSASSMSWVPGLGVCWDVHATTVKGAMAHMRARKTSDPVSHVWLDESVGGVYADDIITR